MRRRVAATGSRPGYGRGHYRVHRERRHGRERPVPENTAAVAGEGGEAGVCWGCLAGAAGPGEKSRR